MSDGLTHAYREARNYDELKTIIEEATVEYVLLVENVKNMNIGEQFEALVSKSEMTEISTRMMFQCTSSLGTDYLSNSAQKDKHGVLPPKVTQYTINVSTDYGRESFSDTDLKKLLDTVMTHIEVCDTPKVKEAIKHYLSR